MTRYRSTTPQTAFATLELTPYRDDQLIVVQAEKVRRDEAVRQLTASLPGFTPLSETESEGRSVLIWRGPATPSAQILAALGAGGHHLEEEIPPKGFDSWKWRGNLSNAGQVLQLISATFKNKNGHFDQSVLGFAVFNLAANFINIYFGGEERPDPHRLRYIKEQFNHQLERYLPPGVDPPDPDAHLTAGRKVEDDRSEFIKFLNRNSVSFGEIGLRYVGAFNLAFPIMDWGRAGKKAFDAARPQGWEKAMAEGLSAAGKNFRTKDALLFNCGMAYLFGKTIALFSKIPDPYDPEPPSAVDTIREKVLFRASSAIEAAAAAILAYRGLARKPVMEKGVQALDQSGKPLFSRKIHMDSNPRFSRYVPDALKSEGFQQRDWFGGIGGSFFTTALGIRFFAPYGTREVNMTELSAHVAEGLARVPKDKLPQLAADAAASIKAQFPENDKLSYGSVYAQLLEEMENHHHIRLTDKPMAAAPPAEDKTDAPGTQIHSIAAAARQSPPLAAYASVS